MNKTYYFCWNIENGVKMCWVKNRFSKHDVMFVKNLQKKCYKVTTLINCCLNISLTFISWNFPEGNLQIHLEIDRVLFLVYYLYVFVLLLLSFTPSLSLFYMILLNLFHNWRQYIKFCSRFYFNKFSKITTIFLKEMEVNVRKFRN